MRKIKRAEIERFWLHVARRGPDDCWLWSGRHVLKGYGRIRFSGVDYPAHRLALMLTLGHGLKHYACHRCDNPPCCNPAHLYDGTPAQNTNDAITRGRALRGELNGQNKLSEKEVETIRESFSRGARVKDIAQDYKLAQASVSNILQGDTWGSGLGKAETHITRGCRVPERKVLAIRRMRAKGASLRHISKRFGYCMSHICRLCRRKQWFELPRALRQRGSKFNREHALEVHRLVAEGFSGQDIAKRIGMAESMVSRIRHGTVWDDTHPSYKPPPA